MSLLPTARSDQQHRCVDVLLPLALPQAYSYLVPHDMMLVPGDYVRVPLGPRAVIGVVWGEVGAPDDSVDPAKLREISERFDSPAMNADQRAFVDWLADYTLTPPGLVLRMGLRVPSALGPERQDVGYVASGDVPEKITAQRTRVLEIAAEGGVWKASELARQAGVSAGVVKGLVELGALMPRPIPSLLPFDEPKIDARVPVLSGEQAEAAGVLRAQVQKEDYSAILLDGVTGSGKTQVYLEAVAAVLAQDRQVLILLPEIALTSQFLEALEQRFDAAPAPWHSALSPRERERVWRAVARGQASIVVGARSALFLPFADLGLIVVDEEHDPAFKQEEGVMYHARDMAVVRASIGKFPVILSTATPSIESHVNAERGRYIRAMLRERHGPAQLPDIDIIDMRTSAPGTGKWLSPELIEAANVTLEQNEQVLFFLNRRGYAPLTLCRKCGHRQQCTQCDAWLVEHRFVQQMMCHQCGFTISTPKMCPECGEADNLVACGPGVERLAEEVKEAFPDARLAILSSDLMRSTAMLRETLKDITDHKFDIIIGTQLVAKGHHFPQLTLVGVIDADIGLNNGDPRAAERTYQLLWQVSGRAGRADQPGRALVQTYLPEHSLIKALVAKDRDQFYDHECRAREEAGLPPYGRLASLIISSPDQAQANHYANGLARIAPGARDVVVFGPAPAPRALIRGRYRYRLLVKTARDINLQAYLRSWLDQAPKPRGKLQLAVDVDPQSFL